MGNKPYEVEIIADVAKAVKSTGDLEDAVTDLADSLDEIEDATKSAATGSERNLDKIGDSLDDVEKASKDAATGSERNLDKIGDSLDDVGDEAKKTGQKLEDEITQGVKDAGRSADKMESSFSDAFDGMRKRSRDASEDINRNTQKLDDAQAEVLDEMTQNWGETMSSWNGTAQDAVRVIADTFGGLAGSMAIGGVAGSLILGAVGGLISVMVQKWEDGSEQIEERNAEMYQAMLENADAYFSQEQVVERFHQQMQGGDDAPMNKKTFQLLQSSTGMSDQQLALADVGPEPLLASALVPRDDGVGRGEHVLGGAVVLVEDDRLGPGEGDLRARTGDWVIRNAEGEFYPCDPDIFAATYEEADA